MTIGIVAGALGALGLVLASPHPFLALGAVLLLVGALIVVTATVAGIVRHQLRRQAGFVTRTVERGMLDALPPGAVLEHLLDRVYGPSPSNRGLVTAVLGGEGAAHDGSDLTISDHTEVDLQLSWIDETTYRMVMEQRYRFRSRVPSALFVIFATSDYELRDRIIAGCRVPLFDMWFVGADQADDYFDDSVESMRDTVHLGLHYVDAADEKHAVAARAPQQHVEEVQLSDWGRYLTFFRTDLPAGQRLDRREYMDKLRIFAFSLQPMAETSSPIATVQRLSVRYTMLQRLGSGYCYWEAPFPCHMERMSFDTTRMTGADLQFHLKPFTFGAPASPVPWKTGDPVVEVPVGNWILPGQGVALMWRAA
ncbi:hypothetical protein [Actinomycetospora callitridis]|uniref:hypothetical protein n=1 Tax=Actinomycetospora callitridis TaxID=913944 RepID=UPI002366C97F|nr:hypothetical protein [Actinomycetospora callitridis]MDD7920152.1 hypothetical protein [Actinomycetospora callitridis]